MTGPAWDPGLPPDQDDLEGERGRKALRPPLAKSSGVEPRPTRPSPTDRLAEMTREHVDSLDRERQRLLDEVERLQDEWHELLPENARLKEALGNSVANGVLASILIAVGGAAISDAAFVRPVELAVASAGVAALLAGVLVLAVSSIRGGRARSVRDGRRTFPWRPERTD